MYTAVKEKFGDNHPALKTKLLATGTTILRNASKQDNYWGLGRKRLGQNKLGIILMRVRDEMRAQLRGVPLGASDSKDEMVTTAGVAATVAAEAATAQQVPPEPGTVVNLTLQAPLPAQLPVAMPAAMPAAMPGQLPAQLPAALPVAMPAAVQGPPPGAVPLQPLPFAPVPAPGPGSNPPPGQQAGPPMLEITEAPPQPQVGLLPPEAVPPPGLPPALPPVFPPAPLAFPPAPPQGGGFAAAEEPEYKTVVINQAVP
jgi:hypothetical protein